MQLKLPKQHLAWYTYKTLSSVLTWNSSNVTGKSLHLVNTLSTKIIAALIRYWQFSGNYRVNGNRETTIPLSNQSYKHKQTLNRCPSEPNYLHKYSSCKVSFTLTNKGKNNRWKKLPLPSSIIDVYNLSKFLTSFQTLDKDEASSERSLAFSQFFQPSGSV